MKIDFNENQIAFLRETLTDVDSRAYDPVYKNTVDRVAVSTTAQNGVEMTNVVLEEFEVFTLIEALQERSEHLTTSEEVKKQCVSELEFITANTGLSL